MTENTTITAARNVARDDARDRLSLDAMKLNLVNKAVKIGGHPEILPEHVRAMKIIDDALDSIVGPPATDYEQARAAGVQAVGNALGVAAE
jgi:hypothetical protein